MDFYTCKAKSLHDGKWIYGYVSRPDYMTNELCFVGPEFIIRRIDQNTICRYTGKEDKNGNPIFENDIVVGKAGVPMLVCWNDVWVCFEVMYEIKGIGPQVNSLCASEKLEIIGNDFDNTELMGGLKMLLHANILINFSDLKNMLNEHSIPRDGFTRLMMNDYTVHVLTGKHFYDDRLQSYYGFPIIECRDCVVGEVIVLVNYERFREVQNEASI